MLAPFLHRSAHVPTVRGSRQKLSNRNRADLAGLPRYGGVPTEKTASSSRGVLSTDIPLRGMSLIALVAFLKD